LNIANEREFTKQWIDLCENKLKQLNIK